MKKIIITMLTAIMTLGLIACGSSNTSDNTTKTTQAVTQSDNITEENTDTKSNSNTAVTNSNVKEDSTASNKTLVVYFSCTGNTKNIAMNIAEGLNADVYEIKAQQPYSSADLNYNDKNSRSTKEMNDKNSRPAISGNVANWADYSTIYLGA